MYNYYVRVRMTATLSEPEFIFSELLAVILIFVSALTWSVWVSSCSGHFCDLFCPIVECRVVV